MPAVWIPSLMRDLTGGQAMLNVPGDTVQQVIDSLEERCPGIKDRLMDGERLRPGILVVVDGASSARRLRHRLSETSEIHFLPAISGG